MIRSFRLTNSIARISRAPLIARYSATSLASSDIPPVSILAGFLGAGKTSTLTHILQNREGMKVGVIVNDVASVNVDANVVKRLVSQQSNETNGEQTSSVLDMIELENGCVCCGPEAGQLAPAVKSLAATGQERGAPFDHIVIELSGVADPAMVKHLLIQGGVQVEKVITLVDADAFPALYHSADEMLTRDDLGGGQAAAEADPCTGMKKVVELLISQIEEADMIVANKVDLASDLSMKTTMFICEALNPQALLKRSKLGQLPLSELLPKTKDDEETHHDGHASLSHDHSHGHSHEHHGDHHGHDHSHEHTECHDHTCNDPTHDHSHSHSHDHSDSLAAENLGITNFVYRADRPFSEPRLMSRVIDTWPVPKKDSVFLSDYSKSSSSSEAPVNVFTSVLRSKGWVFLDKYPSQSIFWTHAGHHLGLEMMPQEHKETVSEPIAQELVFIGMGLDEKKITETLDQCLLTDDEMIKYEEKLQTNGTVLDLPTPRFPLGATVEARTGPEDWVKGTIVAIHYREPEWPSYQATAPYQIKLENGQLIYAPADIDEVVRMAP